MLPDNYIDTNISGTERELLEVFYEGCLGEGGTADEVTLRGLHAVLAKFGMQPQHRPELVRYGVTWDGSPDKPLLTPMPDGYWTPWHVAAGLSSVLQ